MSDDFRYGAVVGSRGGEPYGLWRIKSEWLESVGKVVENVDGQALAELSCRRTLGCSM